MTRRERAFRKAWRRFACGDWIAGRRGRRIAWWWRAFVTGAEPGVCPFRKRRYRRAWEAGRHMAHMAP